MYTVYVTGYDIFISLTERALVRYQGGKYMSEAYNQSLFRGADCSFVSSVCSRYRPLFSNNCLVNVEFIVN